MRAQVIKDPTHPDYPHGKPEGAWRGCKCADCLRARRISNYQSRRLREQGITRYAPDELRQRVQNHVDALVRVTGVSLAAISRAAGVEGKRAGEVHRGMGVATVTAHKLLAVTPAKALEYLTYIDVEPFRLITGQLQALGYTYRWQERQVGACHRYVNLILDRARNGRQDRMDVEAFTKWQDLLAEYGDREATTEDGLSPMQIKQAKTVATRNGFYPPACYDDDGNLNYRFVPDHPWARADEYAHDKLRDLRIITARNLDEKQYRMARALGLDSAAELPTDDNGMKHSNPTLWTAAETLRQSCTRLKETLGLRDKDPERHERAAWWRDQLARFEYSYSGEETLAFALRTGLITVKANQVPLSHPTVQAYLAEQGVEVAA